MKIPDQLKIFFYSLIRDGFIKTITKSYYHIKQTFMKHRNYSVWIDKNEPWHINGNRILNDQLNQLKFKPLITIIITNKNNSELIYTSLDSIINQIYPNWELIVCFDDSSTEINLSEYKSKSIKGSIYSIENKSITKAVNQAISKSEGDFIAFLDYTDLLSISALLEIVILLNSNNKIDYIYSDEDLIDSDGKRHQPLFKPDWSPEYFKSYMYTGSFGVFRKEIIQKVKGISENDNWYYDLCLKVIENTDNIYHIPKVLFHKKIINNNNLLEQSKSGIEALEAHLKRQNRIGKVIPLNNKPGLFYINYKINKDPLVSIIIPTKDLVVDLKKCIDSILHKTDYLNYEIIIINNNSKLNETYEYFEEIEKYDNINIVEYFKPFNFAAINNFGLKKSKGDYICFLNNDTEVINNNWLSSMLELAQQNEIGVVGAKLLYSDGTIQHAGIVLGIRKASAHVLTGLKSTDKGYLNRLSVINNYNAVTAACMLTKRSIYLEVDGMDENLPVMYNDVDYCLKVREKGYRVVYTPHAKLYHFESKSRGSDIKFNRWNNEMDEYNYMLKKWSDKLIKGDPYYNPNLNSYKADFKINI